MIRCHNCGAAVTNSSNFCQYCGAKLGDSISAKIDVSQVIEDKARMAEAGAVSVRVTASAILGCLVGIAMVIAGVLQENENVTILFVIFAMAVVIVCTKPMRSHFSQRQ